MLLEHIFDDHSSKVLETVDVLLNKEQIKRPFIKQDIFSKNINDKVQLCAKTLLPNGK